MKNNINFFVKDIASFEQYLPFEFVSTSYYMKRIEKCKTVLTIRKRNLDGINSVNTKCTNDFLDVDKELRTF